MYRGEHFTFGDEPTGSWFEPVDFYGKRYGWASFDEPWYYEHMVIVPVPRDLSGFGIDTSQEDGVSLFKNGAVVYDAYANALVPARDMQPAMGCRYYEMPESPGDNGYCFEDYFDLDADTGMFVLIGD